jgi:hypothetical protein
MLLLRWRDAAMVAAFGLWLVGCSFPSDYFGQRAVEYNREAEQSTQKALLLNIVRASKRLPMQFTGLQSVTGTSSSSGGVTTGGTSTKQTPYIQGFNLTPPATSTIISETIARNLGGSASISGGPTFTVPVLDTQEFYSGILQPIPLQVIDFYLQEGFPPELIFDLFVSKVTVTRIDDGSCRQFSFTNSVGSDLQFGQFQALADYLIGSGLWTERISKSTPFGAPLPAVSAKAKAGDVARTLDAYTKAAQAGLALKREKSGQYQLEKKSSEIRSCFVYRGGQYPDWLLAKDKSIFCGQFEASQAGKGGANASGPQMCKPKSAAKVTKNTSNYQIDPQRQGITEHGLSEFKGIALSPRFLQRIDAFQRQILSRPPEQISQITDADLFNVRDFAGAHVSFEFHTRSTEGILYYLGEIVRRQLYPEYGATPRVIQTKSAVRYATYPMSGCGKLAGPPSGADIAWLSNLPQYRETRVPFRCENIFVVQTGQLPLNSVTSVLYGGVLYSIPSNNENGGRSSQVLELVKQVLNLNTSAKQLPSTTVISVVGAQ